MLKHKPARDLLFRTRRSLSAGSDPTQAASSFTNHRTIFDTIDAQDAGNQQNNPRKVHNIYRQPRRRYHPPNVQYWSSSRARQALQWSESDIEVFTDGVYNYDCEICRQKACEEGRRRDYYWNNRSSFSGRVLTSLQSDFISTDDQPDYKSKKRAMSEGDAFKKQSLVLQSRTALQHRPTRQKSSAAALFCPIILKSSLKSTTSYSFKSDNSDSEVYNCSDLKRTSQGVAEKRRESLKSITSIFSRRKSVQTNRTMEGEESEEKDLKKERIPTDFTDMRLYYTLNGRRNSFETSQRNEGEKINHDKNVGARVTEYSNIDFQLENKYFTTHYRNLNTSVTSFAKTLKIVIYFNEKQVIRDRAIVRLGSSGRILFLTMRLSFQAAKVNRRAITCDSSTDYDDRILLPFQVDPHRTTITVPLSGPFVVEGPIVSLCV